MRGQLDHGRIALADGGAEQIVAYLDLLAICIGDGRRRWRRSGRGQRSHIQISVRRVIVIIFMEHAIFVDCHTRSM